MRTIKTVFIIGGLILMTCAFTHSSNVHPPTITVNEENIYNTVYALSSIKPPRTFLHIDSLNQAASYIEKKFIEYGYTPQKQKYFVNKTEVKNIIARHGQETSPKVVVGAHYDVCGNQPGADDNGSGVAGVLELARLFSKYKPKLDYQVEFVTYSLEEPPFFRTEHMGSYVHAKSLSDNGVKLKAMICLEMIGFFSNEKNIQKYPAPFMNLFYPSEANFIAVVGRFSDSSLVNHTYTHLKASKTETEKLKTFRFIPGVDFSDHRNYWKFGYKAVMVTDTSFYRNDNYHQASDTIDTLNFPEMAKVIRGLYWTLLNLK